MRQVQQPLEFLGFDRNCYPGLNPAIRLKPRAANDDLHNKIAHLQAELGELKTLLQSQEHDA